MKRIFIGLLWLVILVLSILESRENKECYTADPGTVAIVLAVIGTTMSVQAQRQQAKSSRAVAKYNAALAQQKADEERRTAKLQTEARRKGSRRLLASQRAAFAKGGVTPAGTPFALMTETAKNEALSALFIGREGELSARELESRGELYSMQAKDIGKAGRLAVGGELLGGISTTISAYTTAKSLKKIPKKTGTGTPSLSSRIS